MNRPNKDNFVYCSGAIFDSEKYEEKIEKYCDALEKALDKASIKLYELCDDEISEYAWKVWCMKDVD